MKSELPANAPRLKREPLPRTVHRRKAYAVHLLHSRFGYAVRELAAVFDTTPGNIRQLAARGAREDGKRIVVVCPSEDEFRQWRRDIVKLPEWAARRAHSAADAALLSNFTLVAWGADRWTRASREAHAMLLDRIRLGRGELPTLEVPTPP